MRKVRSIIIILIACLALAYSLGAVYGQVVHEGEALPDDDVDEGESVTSEHSRPLPREVHEEETEEQAWEDSPVTNLPGLEETVAADEDGLLTVTNPDHVLVLVNKERNLPADYVPDDLVIPDVRFPFDEDHPKKLMRQDAAEALQQLISQAWEESLELYALSGYRSYETQRQIFAYNVGQKGEEAANQFSARPGQSEHQTGLAMDVTSPQVGFALTQSFADTTEGRWLREHAREFGFIIRYPEGKEDITGYQYEPWHLRYVGVEHAVSICEEELTLEEYLGQR